MQRETRSVIIPRLDEPRGSSPSVARPTLSGRIGTRLDRLLSIFAPRMAAARMGARATLNQIEIFSNGQGGYEGGKLNRLTRGHLTNRINENAVPLFQVQRLRWQAMDLFRNNPQARKLLRTLLAKVTPLVPNPQATKASGKPNKQFRRRAKEIWHAAQRSLDYRGRASKGGQHGTTLQRLALSSAVITGDCLYHAKPLSRKRMQELESPVPVALQLIHTERLAEYLTLASSEQIPDHRLFRGIEIDPEGIVAAYWILRHHPSDPMMFSSVQQADRYSADEIHHLYVPDDVDQFRGTSWFAPCLMEMRDAADYKYSELKAAALAACFTLWYRPPTNSTQLNPLGTQMPIEWDLVDGDGNPLTAVQPGMFLNMGHDGELNMLSPNRPNTSAEAFINFMLRSTATGFPGIKSSTLTGDYRNSSFSSERSADNDAWPELEGVQQWFGHGFCQPVYELIIDAAVLMGLFDDVISIEEYRERKGDLLRCQWQGPIPRSINPTDDAKAAKMRIENGTSTPQIEAAALGRDWHEVIKDVGEFIARARKEGIPDELIEQYLGFASRRTITDDGSSDGGSGGKKSKKSNDDRGVKSWVGPNGEDLSLTRSAFAGSGVL